MQVTAKICLLDDTQSGISKSTGNPWVAKSMVIEVECEDGHRDTLAVRTMNADVVKVLEGCLKGDIIDVELGFASRVRIYTRRDGTEGTDRSTDVYVRKVKVKEASF